MEPTYPITARRRERPSTPGSAWRPRPPLRYTSRVTPRLPDTSVLFSLRSRRLACVAAVCAIVIGAAIHTPASASVDPKLAGRIATLAASEPEQSVVAWVYFTDRAGAERDPAASTPRAALSPRALARRAARAARCATSTPSDLPVHEPYVRALVARGARLRGASRWLNAASVELPARLVAELARLPFVARVELVPIAARLRGSRWPRPRASRRRRHRDGSRAPTPRARSGAAGARRHRVLRRRVQAARDDAGAAAPRAGALGRRRAGVHARLRLPHHAPRVRQPRRRRAARLHPRRHERRRRAGAGRAGRRPSHGTSTLGCVAGSKPGTYSGGAFGASVALGKTEYVPPRRRSRWTTGSSAPSGPTAWAPTSSRRASATPSSTIPTPSYTYADMDGRTTVVTLAAVEAVRRGITVVNAAGNEGAVAVALHHRARPTPTR